MGHVSLSKSLVHLHWRQQHGTGTLTVSSGSGVSEPLAHQCREHRPVGLGQDTRSSPQLCHQEPRGPVYTPGRRMDKWKAGWASEDYGWGPELGMPTSDGRLAT